MAAVTAPRLAGRCQELRLISDAQTAALQFRPSRTSCSVHPRYHLSHGGYQEASRDSALGRPSVAHMNRCPQLGVNNSS